MQNRLMLQAEGVPDAHHGALRQATALRHRSAAPLRSRARLLMKSFGNHLLDHRIANSAWRRRHGSE